jgi:DNA mismatch repair protein MutL
MALDGHIRLLPVQVANKIAAGEVLERPASAVKELAENALDAGAKRIEIHVTAGGRKLVEVRDDGAGMTRDDALLSIERHATSKIRDVDDVERIATLGFRGEALPSIASVSRFTMRTCRQGETVGTELVVIGGRLQDVRDAGVPPGTTVEVRDLFFNVPARRNFLRAYQTEQAHIRTVFNLVALAHPDVGLLLKSDGAEVCRLPPDSRFEERVCDLFGADFTAGLRPVNREHAGVRVTGLVGLPTQTRADRSEQYIFVNRRPASAAVIPYALREAYPPLEGDRKPIVFLFVDLDPTLVDVNVHPSKREVRFRRPADVREAVILAVSAALGRTPPRAAAPLPVAGVAPDAGSAFPPVLPPRERPERELPLPTPQAPAMRIDYPAPPAIAAVPAAAAVGVGASPTAVPLTAALSDASEGSPWRWCRVLGQVGGLYVLLETDDGYVVLDPRAAHERVIYERLQARLKDGSTLSQRLLIPETVHLPPADAARLRQHLKVVQTMGFGIEDFGNDHFLVEALPPEVAQAPRRELLMDICHDLDTAGVRRGAETWREDVVIKAACRAAVRVDGVLAAVEIERLVADLAGTRMPYTCPRGRPTMILTPYRELARKFGRE